MKNFIKMNLLKSLKKIMYFFLIFFIFKNFIAIINFKNKKISLSQFSNKFIDAD